MHGRGRWANGVSLGHPQAFVERLGEKKIAASIGSRGIKSAKTTSYQLGMIVCMSCTRSAVTLFKRRLRYHGVSRNQPCDRMKTAINSRRPRPSNQQRRGYTDVCPHRNIPWKHGCSESGDTLSRVSPNPSRLCYVHTNPDIDCPM